MESLVEARATVEKPRLTTVKEFWADFGAWMRPELRSACTRIAEKIEDDWACYNAQDMSALWLHDIQPVFEACGGKATWAFRVEQDLGFQFKRFSNGVPASAKFYLDMSSEPAQREIPCVPRRTDGRRCSHADEARRKATSRRHAA